jgi:hypothetical protein
MVSDYKNQAEFKLGPSRENKRKDAGFETNIPWGKSCSVFKVLTTTFFFGYRVTLLLSVKMS